ncbi:MAG: hypothetical protein Q4C87_01705 [Actinomycetaceae bacterium]|nr:hypothetical protein [Actinomycetaceae bacterium]
MEFQIRPLVQWVTNSVQPLVDAPMSNDPYPKEILERLTFYLRNCVILVPWMGTTKDQIGGKFETVGGCEIHTDGRYYWQYDAADYLEHYPIRIDEEALEYFISIDWRPPSFGQFDPIKYAMREAYDSYSDDNFPADGIITVHYEP